MATIKEVAKYAGVSITTVSRVLNNDPQFSVSEDTRSMILHAADELGYKRKHVFPEIQTIALLYELTEMEDLEDIYYKQIALELEKNAKSRNMVIHRYNKVDGVDHIDPKTDAFVVTGPLSPNEVKKVLSISQTGVIIDTISMDGIFDSVRPNLPLMIQQMIQYFIRNGHKKIGLICGRNLSMDREIEPLDSREIAFRQYMRGCGLLDEKYILHPESGSVNSGYQCALRAIESLGEDLPTAFCVANDPLAVGVLQALHEKEIAVPQRVSLFSINDIIVSKYIFPPLTTFHIDIPSMCKIALDLLEERLLKKQMPQRTILLGGTPIYRKSVEKIENP